MNENIRNQWLQWANQNQIDSRLTNFLAENTQFLETANVPTQLILETSRFLKKAGRADDRVCRAVQLVLGIRPDMAEFGARLADYIKEHPEPEQETNMNEFQEEQTNPINIDQKLPNRDTYIKKDEVTNMIIGLEMCKTGEDFNKWLEEL